jgi:hypothetical protein
MGYTGVPATKLYGCRECVVFKHRRLPVWPEYGAV